MTAWESLDPLTSIADADELVTRDVSDTAGSAAGTHKRITRANLLTGMATQAALDALPEIQSADTSELVVNTPSGGVQTLAIGPGVARAPVTAILTADATAINNNATTFTTILTVPFEASHTYEISGVLYYTGTGTADMDAVLDTSVAVTGGQWNGIGARPGHTGTNFSASSIDATANNFGVIAAWHAAVNTMSVFLRGILRVGATAGNLTVGMRQNVAEASDLVPKANSFITLTPIVVP